jgi:hypothetical protein
MVSFVVLRPLFCIMSIVFIAGVRVQLRRSSLHDLSDEGHLSDPVGGLPENYGGAQGRHQLLHVAHDQELHEEGHAAARFPRLFQRK